MAHNKKCEREGCEKRAVWMIEQKNNGDDEDKILSCAKCLMKLVPNNDLRHTMIDISDWDSV